MTEMTIFDIKENIKRQLPIIRPVLRCTICNRIWNGECGCEKKYIKGSAMRLRTLKEKEIKTVYLANIWVEYFTLLKYLQNCRNLDIVSLEVIDDMLVLTSVKSKDNYRARFYLTFKEG